MCGLKQLLTGFFGACALLAPMAFAGSPPTAGVRVVVGFDDIAPGFGATFDTLSPPALNNLGQAAFVGVLNDDDLTTGVWSEGDGIGALRSVAAVGEPAPGAIGRTFGDFDTRVHLSDAGDVAFRAYVDDLSTRGLWTDRDRPSVGLTPVAIEGDQAPGAAVGREYRFGFGFRSMNAATSSLAFWSSLTPGDPPNNFSSQAVYNEGVGSVVGEVAEFFDLAPGTVRPPVGGGLANFEGFESPAMNSLGEVAFSAQTNAGTGFDSIGDGGVWSTVGGSLTPVALAGQAAPGTATTFSQLFGTTTMNDAGDVAFTATLTGLIEGALRDGVWVDRGGGLAKVAQEAEPAPGTTADFNFIEPDITIDSLGRAAFAATLDDGSEGVWRESAPGVLEPALIEGQTPVGAPAAVTNITDYTMNSSGRLVAQADLADFTFGLFDIDTAGVATKIVATGDVLDFGDGPVEITEIDFTGAFGSPTATATGYNDAGQVAAYLEGESVDTFEFFSAIVVFDAPASVAVAGDFNGDGRVDNGDLNLLLSSWGEAASPAPAGWEGDPPTSPAIDNDELNALLSNWGSGTANAAPEPATAGSVALLVLAFDQRRRRERR